MFGSVAKVDMLASLFCLQALRFVIKLWLGAVVSNVCWALLRELHNNEWEAGVKTMNGSPTVCKSHTS